MKGLKEKRSVALLSVFAAIFLTTFKLIVGLVTNSLGILSEALHSGLDLIAAVITYIAVKISGKPKDADHHFGHGKIENLSALVETVLLFVTCGWIIHESLNRLISGNVHLEISVWSYIVIISSIIIDIWRSRALKKAADKYNSQALEADALHFSTDIWSSLVVLLSLICSNFGYYYADSIAALGVAIIVITVCYRLGKRAIDALLDRAPIEETKSIKMILKNFNKILKYHDLRVRESGPQLQIEVTVHVGSLLSLADAHKISEELETLIKEKYDGAEVTVHVEPDTH